MIRDFFLGFIKVHILHHASRESVYGLQLIVELGRHGYNISPGTLYPVLHDLERSGYLLREDRLVMGKIRKYYRSSPLGERALEEARQRIRELVIEVLQDEGPLSLPEAESSSEEEAIIKRSIDSAQPVSPTA